MTRPLVNYDSIAEIYDLYVFDGKPICTLRNPAARRVTVDGLLRVVGRVPCPEGTLVVSRAARS